MSKLELINQKIKNTGLELYGSRGNYVLIPIYSENTIFFKGYEFMNTKTYKNLNSPIKSWIKSAKILESKIKRNYI